MATIKEDIADYVTEAGALNAKRALIKTAIRIAMRREIIPAIEPSLPEGYSINHERSRVRNPSCITFTLGPEREGVHDASRDEVPTGFSLDLRIQYEGKPLAGGPGMDRFGEITGQLEPRLKEMAEKYGLSCIALMDEPLQIP